MRNVIPVDQLLTSWLRPAFEKASPDAGGLLDNLCVVAASSEAFGDYQCSQAMALAKALKRNPKDIAQEALKHTKPHECLDRVEVAGTGFINMHLNPDWVAGYITEMESDDHLGVPQIGQGHTVVIDYSGPNIAKPLHIGHLRSTNIGNALDRLHRFLGYRVISDNHLGDWGTQFGITILGYRHFGDKTAIEKSTLEELERVYVKSYERSESDPEWHNACKQELVKLQQGDEENVRMWKLFIELSLNELKSIYKRMDVSFDLVRGESYYRDRLQQTVDTLACKELARRSEGALVVFLDDEKLPPCIVQKSDGGFNYATTDIAAIINRVEEFHPDKIIYVTDERQQLHFKQIFAIAKKLDCNAELCHVWFGLMRLPEGTFSTRQGNVIKLDHLLNEAERRALEVVRKTNPDMDADQQKRIAQAVGIGAVKYEDISQNARSVVTFTWNKALNLEGNSAPYLQYAYARIASVQDKYREQFPNGNLAAWPVKLVEPIEKQIGVKAARFPEIVLKATTSYRPNMLADYLYELAGVYNTFYQNIPFLKAPEGVRESRVRLCGIVARVLKTGLTLLGIETPERI